MTHPGPGPTGPGPGGPGPKPGPTGPTPRGNGHARQLLVAFMNWIDEQDADSGEPPFTAEERLLLVDGFLAAVPDSLSSFTDAFYDPEILGAS